MYDRIQRGFVLDGVHDPVMSDAEILAVSKILLEIRAFSGEEMRQTLTKMLALYQE